MQTAKLQISGMHCSACSQNIQNHLQKIPAITQSKINPITGKAKISFDPSKLSVESLIELISSYGFPTTLDQSQEQAQHDLLMLRQRLFVALPLFVMVFVLHLPIWDHSFALWQWIFASIIQSYCGYPFYKGSLFCFKNKSADMNLLISLGTSVAYLYSCYLFFFNQAHAYYFEGSSAVICFVLVGEYLKSKAKCQASANLQSLLKILPTKAKVLPQNQANQAKWVDFSELREGDICLVSHGEKIPADGVITQGEAEISSAHINGEALPKHLKIGDEVLAGSLVIEGEICLQISKDPHDFFILEMLDLLELSQMQTPPIGKIANKIASIFVPFVLAFSLLAFSFWVLKGEGVGFGLLIVASILVVSCPCALGLATPLAIVNASLRAKKDHILIKDPSLYEKIDQIRYLALDKTGTLTKGEIHIEQAKHYNNNVPQNLQIIAQMQQHNNHPIAKALFDWASQNNPQPITLTHKEYCIAKGIKAKFQNQEYFLGSKAWVLEQSQNRNNPTIPKEASILFANQHEVLASFILSDSIKEGAKEMIDFFKQQKITPLILSGDEESQVQKIAQSLGIEQYFSALSPFDKLEKIKALQKQGGVCFVGDGINDALALKEANLSISFVHATELAKEAGEVLLFDSNLTSITKVFILAKKTLQNIWQNLFFAYCYNLLLIPIAAGALYPFGLILEPAFAGGAMALSSISVVLNALRILKIKLA